MSGWEYTTNLTCPVCENDMEVTVDIDPPDKGVGIFGYAVYMPTVLTCTTRGHVWQGLELACAERTIIENAVDSLTDPGDPT